MSAPPLRMLGLDHVVRNGYFLLDVPLGGYHLVNGALWAISGFGLLWLLRVFPDRASTPVAMWGMLLAIAIALTLLHWAFLTLFIWDHYVANFAQPQQQAPWPLAFAQLGNAWFTVIGHVFVWGLALKHRRATLHAARLRIVTIAVAPYFLLSSVVLIRYALFAGTLGATIGWSLGALGGFVTVALWFWNGATTSDRRTSRNIGLGLLGVMVAGSLLMAWAPAHVEWSNLGLFGLARLIGVVVLAHTLVRYRLFDLDVRIRWTIRKGTVASAFFLVFIIVGVVAENFLTDRYGWAVGGVGAGLLLFAIRPLEQLGSRISARALPSAIPIARRGEAERASMFEHMAREAWADGQLSKAERRVLEVARQRLGLTEAKALAIETAAMG